jgi:hypothetical protein
MHSAATGLATCRLGSGTLPTRTGCPGPGGLSRGGDIGGHSYGDITGSAGWARMTGAKLEIGMRPCALVGITMLLAMSHVFAQGDWQMGPALPTPMGEIMGAVVAAIAAPFHRLEILAHIGP